MRILIPFALTLAVSFTWGSITGAGDDPGAKAIVGPQEDLVAAPAEAVEAPAKTTSPGPDPGASTIKGDGRVSAAETVERAPYFDKLDPQLRLLLCRATPRADRTGRTRAAPFPCPRPPDPEDVVSDAYSAESYLTCHVELNSAEGDLAHPGAVLHSRSGDVALVSVKTGALESLASNSDVAAVRLAPVMSLKNDLATVETGARRARETYGATGSGVIMGFIGSGVDVSHPDLLDDSGGSRILYLLDLSEPGDTDGDGMLDGPDFFGGTLYAKSQIDSALAGLRDITGSDRRGHETHVIGVAAGNGRGTGNGFPAGAYAGVATDADILVVKSSPADLGLVGPGEGSAGLAFVDSVAAELGAPYVVNMSFGTHLSPHDGTSLEERFIDNLVGDGRPGKAVVVSAGNEGSNYGAGPFLHCSDALDEGGKATCAITLGEYDPEPGSLNDGLILDVWYGGGDAMKVTVESPAGETYVASKGGSGRWTGADGSVSIDNAPSPSPLNEDNECFVQIDDGDGNPPAAGTWTIEIEATAVTENGRFDAWLAYSAGLGGEVGFDPTSPVTNEALVASPGNALNAVTVGSYTNKESWLDLDNNVIYFEPRGEPPSGAIAPGSSPGPTRDGRVKPEVAAPGRAIVSTLSQDSWPGTNEISIFNGCPANARRCLIAGDGRHAVARGTSFAAAHAAGAAALLLETSPDLDAEELRNLLAFTARTAHESEGPWGFGKIDVQAALEAADAGKLVDFFEAAYGPKYVKLSWRASPETAVEGFRLYKASALKGPYDMLHDSAGPEGTYTDSEVRPDDLVYYRLGALLPGGEERLLAPITPDRPKVRPRVALLSLFPNPAGVLTNLRFSSTRDGTAVARAYDAAGRLVDERVIGVVRAGAETAYKWAWVDRDGERVPSGVYYLSVEVAGSRAVGRAIVLR
jgi:hypothetical protein